MRRIDDRAERWVAATDHGPLRPVLRVSARAADLLLPSVAATLRAALAGPREARLVVVRAWVAAATAALLENALLKPLTGRDRPDPHRLPANQRRQAAPSTSAFPSGHVGAATAFAVTAGAGVAELRPWLTATSALTAYARVFTGRHHPSDVVVGAAIGLAASLALQRAGRRSSARAGLERSRRDRPAPVLRRRWTVVGDEVVHSRETADASQPGARPLVFLHGVGTTSRYAVPLLRELAGRRSAAVVELPGIGSSSARHVPTAVAGQADHVAGWLRATRRHPAVVVGNSMGAQTAVELAVRHPELVERLVLLGPTVDRAARTLPRQVGRLLVDATVERTSLLAVTFTDTFLTQRRAVWRYLRASLDHAMEDRIGLVAVPVLLVRGERDPLASRRWIAELAALAGDADQREVPGAAHACHHGAPALVADLLVEVTADHAAVVATPRRASP